MVDFKALKRQSGDISQLNKALEKINAPANERQEDTRFWQPDVDKTTGNGFAVIRFLPAPAVDGDDALPWVRVFSHAFKGPTGKWYIENSLTTLNLKDPVSEFNSKLWNESSDDNSPSRKQARDQKRKLTYIANIKVITDSKHPENEGKVFLYKFGKKIFDKITAQMNPEFEGDEPVNPFDFWAGANFRLKIKNVAGYRNYDSSEFDKPSAISSNDDEIEALWKTQYSLKEFIDPSQFKTYDQLKARLDEVLEIGTPAGARASVAAKQSKVVEEDADDIPPWSKKASDDDDDVGLDFFTSLAADA
jgi:hypothetical protein